MNRHLLHGLSVLLRLQMLHKNLGGLEVFLADGAGGDGHSTGKLGMEVQSIILMQHKMRSGATFCMCY